MDTYNNNTHSTSSGSVTTAKDFFLWLGAIVALYFSVGSLVTLLFGIIDSAFTVSVIGYDPYSGGISFAIAGLLVIFPVYLLLTRLNNQSARRDVTKKNLWARKWGIYLTLFLSGGGMLIDLITLVYTFLQGEEMTPEFLLKVLVILVVFGAVFFYYLKDINEYWQSREKLSKGIGAGVAVVVVASIICGFFIMGSPATQRKLKQDRSRISDLQSIQYELTEYYRNKQELPDSLADLADPLAGRGYIARDPETGVEYEYEKTSELTFSLCADFSMEGPQISADSLTGEYDDWRVQDLMQEAEQWPHGEGRSCFERTVDPEKYEKYLPLSPKAIRID